MLPFRVFFSLILFVFPVTRGAPLAERQNAAPTVTLSSGVLVGTTTQYPGATATNNKFLGIPYAQSPPLRFGLPQAAAPWISPLQATSYKPACIQQPFGSSPTPNGQSEDCLYVNIFTPPGSEPNCKKEVMVWLYGGNLQAGDASVPTYDGSSFAAEQDVIVVTFNYRTSAFGFSNSPQIPTSQQNVGFFDQRFLLQWVQSNIAAFGGDPTKVTIFGQSAGGYSVKYLLAYPPSPLPYRAAIMESEATLILGSGTASWNALATQLGCATATDVLACVRAADALKIQSIVVNGSLGFPPVNDGQTFISDPTPRFTSKQAARVPVVIGTNGQEASAASALLGLDSNPSSNLTDAINEVLPGLGATAAPILEALYPGEPVGVLVDYLLTAYGFQCPAAELAQTLESSGNPTWRYFYNASIPNIDATAGYPNAGAFHTAEIPEVFGTYPRTNATQFEAALSAYMQTNWANFAKNPSSGPAWPGYANQSVAELGNNNVIERTIPASSIDALCLTLDPIINP